MIRLVVMSFDVLADCRCANGVAQQGFTLAESARLMRVTHRPVLARAHKTGRISWKPVAARFGGIGNVSVPVGVYHFPDREVVSPFFYF